MPEHSQSTALLIVDVQKGFINQSTGHIPSLVEVLQQEYRTVFATRFWNPDPSNYRRLINWHRFAEGSLDCELAYSPKAGTHVLDKPVYTCVTAEFLQRLASQEIDTLHICGIDTDICVTKCAVDLFEAGLRPCVLSRFCASHAG